MATSMIQWIYGSMAQFMWSELKERRIPKGSGMEIVKILARFVVSGLAIVATAAILPGIYIQPHTAATYISLAFVVGIVNGVVKPIVKLLAIPLSLVTFGLIHLVINALLLLLVGQIIPNLHIVNFGW